MLEKLIHLSDYRLNTVSEPTKMNKTYSNQQSVLLYFYCFYDGVKTNKVLISYILKFSASNQANLQIYKSSNFTCFTSLEVVSTDSFRNYSQSLFLDFAISTGYEALAR